MIFVFLATSFSQIVALGVDFSSETDVVVQNTNFISLSGTNGGGLYYNNGAGKVSLISCFFHLCQATGYGGGAFLTSGDINVESKIGRAHV